jgi:hypothetical protein
MCWPFPVTVVGRGPNRSEPPNLDSRSAFATP